MKKIQLLILLVLGLFGMAAPARADTNFINLPDTTHEYDNGTGANSIDGNYSTSQYHDNSGEYDSSSTVTSTHTFSTPRNITELRYRIAAYAHVYGDDEQGADVHWKIEYYDGTWHEVTYGGGSESDLDHLPHNCGAGGNATVDHDSGQRVIRVNLSNVTRIRTWSHGHTHSNGDSRTNQSNAQIYEIQAWGAVDIGLRAYDGRGTVKLACEPAGILTSPLRVNKNGTTYAVVLVDAADARASRIRIKTNSGTKALERLD